MRASVHGVTANVKRVESGAFSWWLSVFFLFFVCCSSRFTGPTSHFSFWTGACTLTRRMLQIPPVSRSQWHA